MGRFNEWNEWSGCSPCLIGSEDGVRRRTKECVKPTDNTEGTEFVGTLSPCTDNQNETSDCSCGYNWSEWSHCDCDPNIGKRFRNRYIIYNGLFLTDLLEYSKIYPLTSQPEMTYQKLILSFKDIYHFLLWTMISNISAVCF